MTKLAGTVPYAQYVSSVEAPPPYHFPGVIVHAFVIDIDVDQAQRYADTMFNLGEAKTRGFVYNTVPTWPYGLLLFIQYPEMICAGGRGQTMGSDPAYRDRGIITQTEAFLAIPLMRCGTTWTGVLDTTLDWMLPFITVENPMSAACGREMLGLEKLLSDIDIAEWAYPGSFEGTIKIPGWQTHDPDDIQGLLPFVTVQAHPPLPTPFGPDPLASPMSLLQTRAGSGMVDTLADLSLWAGRLSLGTLPLDMRTVSLKQFRDAANPNLAIYQALVTCRSRYTDVRDFRVFDENGVSIVFNNFASFTPILKVFVNDFELARQGSQVRLPCRAAYSLRATIDFDDMRTIYTAPLDTDRTLAAPIPPESDLTAPWARPWVGLFKGAKRP